MANQIENKVEIVLQGDQFVRRITQEIAIGTQERFIKQIMDQNVSEVLWSPRPVFHGEDIDNTGMVKNIWTGNVTGKFPTHVIVELNYYPLCGAALRQRGEHYILNLKDRRREAIGYNESYPERGFSQEEIDSLTYFDAKPLRIPIQPEHNARIFMQLTLDVWAYTPSIFMLRNSTPYIPKGLPNIFPEDGNLCAGDRWSADTELYSSSTGYSLTKHIKKALVAFSSTAPNNDLSNDDQHAMWGTWDKEGKLTATGAPTRGHEHTNEKVISFVKHLINNPHA